MRCNRTLVTASIAALFWGAAGCAKAMPECFVEVTAYDPSGKPLEGFRITSVQGLHGQDGGMELLGRENEPVIAVTGGIHFIRDFMPSANLWLITLTGDDGRSVQQRAEIWSCRQQRVSVTVGETASLPHEPGAWFESRGRLLGCGLDEAWWVRSRPLFGVPTGVANSSGEVQDANLEPSTGEFRILARHGVRHALLVGSRNSPVKVFAVDLDAGTTDADIGEFDLSGACPAE